MRCSAVVIYDMLGQPGDNYVQRGTMVENTDCIMSYKLSLRIQQRMLYCPTFVEKRPFASCRAPALLLYQPQ